MLDWIRSLPDPLMIVAMIAFGTLCWLLFLCAVMLWDKVQNTAAIRYANLKRENARLKKYISELRKENINGRI